MFDRGKYLPLPVFNPLLFPFLLGEIPFGCLLSCGPEVEKVGAALICCSGILVFIKVSVGVQDISRCVRHLLGKLKIDSASGIGIGRHQAIEKNFVTIGA